MKQVLDTPPNYIAIFSVFGKSEIEKHKPVFCYGDTIFNPFEVTITEDVELHEMVHSKQQGALPGIWWYNYLNDASFRVVQEIEAYGSQYQFVKKLIEVEGGSRKLIDWKKEKMAEALSSALYGNILTYQQAESRIRNYGK